MTQDTTKVLFEYKLTQEKLDDYFEYMMDDETAPKLSKDEIDELIEDIEDAIHDVLGKFVENKQ